jgi:hypothetical protein
MKDLWLFDRYLGIPFNTSGHPTQALTNWYGTYCYKLAAIGDLFCVPALKLKIRIKCKNNNVDVNRVFVERFLC